MDAMSNIEDYSDDERAAYEQGAADTDERYQLMQLQTSQRVARIIELVAKWERHSVVMRSSGYARELRGAIGLGDVAILCTCSDCRGGA
jgi:hypothetical protein